MNLLTEQSTMTETVLQNSTTAILTSIFYQALADSIIWLVAAAVIIVCDLYFGCEAARQRGERIPGFACRPAHGQQSVRILVLGHARYYYFNRI